MSVENEPEPGQGSNPPPGGSAPDGDQADVRPAVQDWRTMPPPAPPQSWSTPELPSAQPPPLHPSPDYPPDSSSEYRRPYPPAEYGPPYLPAARPRDGVSIAAFVTALFGFLLVSVVLSIVGLVRTAGGRRRGRGFAVAGLVLSVAWAAVIGILVSVFLTRPTRPATVAIVPTASTSPTPPSVTVRKRYVDDLRTGDCLLVSKLPDSVLKVPVVPCRQAHDAEVVGVTQLPGSWHGEAALTKLADDACARLFQRYVGIDLDSSEHATGWFGPTADSWAHGDRFLVCYAGDGDATTTGSLKGAKT